MSILLDDRTGSGDLAEPLRRKGAEVEVTRLAFGDAAFVGNGPDGAIIPVGIEIKAIGDLLRVIVDGRFEGHQLPGMQDAYVEKYLIVEGPMKGQDGNLVVPKGRKWGRPDFGRRVWRSGDVGRWLTRQEILHGVRVRRTWSRDDTAQTVLDLHDWFTKEYEEHSEQRDYTQRVVGLLPINLAGRMAKQIDGIGWDKARAVGTHFGTPYNMVLATAAGWQTVAGIGRKLAERAVKAMKEGK